MDGSGQRGGAGVISLQAKLVATIALLLALAAGAWKCYHTGYTRGSGDVTATYTAAALQATEAARLVEQQKQAATAAIDQKLQKEKARDQAAHLAVVSERDSLLDTLARSGPIPPNPAAAIGADDATRTRYILGQCAQAVVGLAETADSLETRLTGLQDYVTTVCK